MKNKRTSILLALVIIQTIGTFSYVSTLLDASQKSNSAQQFTRQYEYAMQLKKDGAKTIHLGRHGNDAVDLEKYLSNNKKNYEKQKGYSNIFNTIKMKFITND